MWLCDFPPAVPDFLEGSGSGVLPGVPQVAVGAFLTLSANREPSKLFVIEALE